GQRYADLSDLQCGAALLNDCKYGYRVKGSVLDLALLRSTKYPDWFADQGKHRFTYSFLPHDRTLAESGVMQDAAVLNRAPILADGFTAGSAAAPCRIDSDGISLEVVKRAEKDDSIILRLVETRGKFSCGTLDFASRPEKVTETDLMEWGDGPALKLKGKTLALEMKPFEIRTLRVRNR
ncbi:MAG: alpha-mannosidase 2c1, partial [Lentisphaeria bacterium]|nr:alpha-mannosidase 2c1 [Lentisphaeria bacterium]